MKNRRLFGGRQYSLVVLFSSKGKAHAKKAPDTGAGQRTSTVNNQHRIIDFAALSAWYTEQNAAKELLRDIRDDWNTPYTYAEKQKNLRFLSL